MRSVAVAPLILLLLSAPVDSASAQVPARVETPYTLIDTESRAYIEGGVETPLRGNGPLTGYGYFFYTRPHFLDEDLYLRLVIPPGYLISELIYDKWPSQHSAFGVGVSGFLLFGTSLTQLELTAVSVAAHLDEGEVRSRLVTERHIGRYILKPIGVSTHIDRSNVLANCGKSDSNDNLCSYFSTFTEQHHNKRY